MRQLSEILPKVLDDMQATSTEAVIPQNTQAHGSTSVDGRTTTPAVRGQSQQAANTTGRGLSCSEGTKLSLKDDPEGRVRLNEVLLMAFDALSTYGKEPEQLDSVKKLMQFVLADFTIQQIREAFAYYFKNNSGFPEPADIAQIIIRGNKPPFEKSIYVNICRKYPENRGPDEWEYMREYERYMIAG